VVSARRELHRVVRAQQADLITSLTDEVCQPICVGLT
jgi:hypothetical protein